MNDERLRKILKMENTPLRAELEEYIRQYTLYALLPDHLLISDRKVDFQGVALFFSEGEIEGYVDKERVFKIYDSTKKENVYLAMNWAFEKANEEYPFFYSNQSVRKRLISVLEPLVVLMEVEDTRGYSHSQRVARRFLSFSKVLGLPETEENLFLRYGMLHDVGRIGLEQLMLYSPTRLRIFEDTGQDHTVAGSIFISTLEVLNDFLPFVRHHHERYDGKGFPDRLQGEQIPYWVRVLSIVNWYDNALNTVDSEFSTGVMSPTEALRVIREDRGRFFDPKIASEFVQFVLFDNDEV
ncbi:MAG: HD domain-containing protein [Thermotogaceae bacterium]|nr:HD domain-containing protein [Thermotogaceae bacterium]OQC30461.1 MAG: Cyclic di-GMP phosphodiesterase response regulator RpfG [Thermotogota bacterium ADurb.Bin062]